MEEFIPPTYEEYLKATEFARIRYKYGLIVTLVACILLVMLIGYVIYYSTELSTNPMQFTAKKFSMSCSCVTTDGKVNYMFNESQVKFEQNAESFLNFIP